LGRKWDDEFIKKRVKPESELHPHRKQKPFLLLKQAKESCKHESKFQAIRSIIILTKLDSRAGKVTEYIASGTSV